MSLYDDIIKTVLSAYPETLAVYRFGSWGTPYQRADSDLDVAVLFPHQSAKDVDFMDWAMLNGRIACLSETDRVDLVNLRTAATDVQAEIIRTGEVVFCRDHDTRLAFEALILSMHQDLNRYREGLYEDIKASCRVLQP